MIKSRLLLLFILNLFLINSKAIAQPIKLIVRGDDMGFSHSGNLALIQCAKEGIQTSIEIIAPSPWFPEAVALLAKNPNLDVGIHLALTSEWDNIKYRPISHVPSLVNADGYFYPMIWPNKNYPGQALIQHDWKLNDIEKEFRAQIELVKKYVPNLSHMSAHMGCYHMSPVVNALAKKLAAEYSIDIDPTENYGAEYIGYTGNHKTLAEKVESFSKTLNTLKPGKSYLFVDHPGLNTPELQAISHIGYENVAEDRQGVTDLWKHPKIKSLIKKRGIQLVSYTDFKKETKSLFNGKNFDGWYIDVPDWDQNKAAPNPFIIRDGKLVSLAEPQGHIITYLKYQNYRLEVEYRFTAQPGNCGVLVHSSSLRRLYNQFPKSIEVQLMHENAGDFWCIGEDIEVPAMETRRGPKANWGVDGEKERRIVNLTNGTEKPLGQWNKMTIECLGNEVKVWLNGVLVNHGFNATASSGQVALQAEGSEVEFNKILLTPITAITK